MTISQIKARLPHGGHAVVANRLNVSVSTVRNALYKTADVSVDTQLKVLREAEKVGNEYQDRRDELAKYDD